MQNIMPAGGLPESANVLGKTLNVAGAAASRVGMIAGALAGPLGALDDRRYRHEDDRDRRAPVQEKGLDRSGLPADLEYTLLCHADVRIPVPAVPARVPQVAAVRIQRDPRLPQVPREDQEDHPAAGDHVQGRRVL